MRKTGLLIAALLLFLVACGRSPNATEGDVRCIGRDAVDLQGFGEK